MMKSVIWTFCPIHGAVAVPEQPRRFFALSDVSSNEENHLIMIIHKHPVILLSTFPDSDDEVHCHKLVHGSDHQLALHAGAHNCSALRLIIAGIAAFFAGILRLGRVFAVAVLIEHTAGKFPLWLTPDQVVVLPVSEKSNDYAWKVKEILEQQDIRVIVDDRNEKIGRKIRDNELKRIPFMLIVGEKEAEEGMVSVRQQGGGEANGSMTIQAFADFINDTVKKQMSAF